MQKQTVTLIIVAIVALLIGFGICCGLRVCGMWGSNNTMPMSGMHMMSDGTMMSNTQGQSASMHSMMMDMNAQLRGKSGDAFDQAFLAEMIVHHEGAVEMAELALKNAKHQEIIDLAKAIIAAQNKEISDMRSWEKQWFGR
ncbi:MAG: DUF305 domain-containing protein [Patescibacteria group bacterium]